MLNKDTSLDYTQPPCSKSPLMGGYGINGSIMGTYYVVADHASFTAGRICHPINTTTCTCNHNHHSGFIKCITIEILLIFFFYIFWKATIVHGLSKKDIHIDESHNVYVPTLLLCTFVYEMLTLMTNIRLLYLG